MGFTVHTPATQNPGSIALASSLLCHSNENNAMVISVFWPFDNKTLNSRRATIKQFFLLFLFSS